MLLTHAEVSNVFNVSHCSVTDLEHVQVIPCSGLGFGNDERGLVHDVSHGAVKTRQLAVPSVGSVAAYVSKSISKR
jgi:hypothetical protein